MAHITELILNLLLLRGKYLTTAAAETLHGVIKKWLKYKRKISTDYNTATRMVGSFENMLEFINYNARQYTCEDKRYVITSEVRYKMYEQLCKTKRQDQISEAQKTKKQDNIPASPAIALSCKKVLDSVTEKLPKKQTSEKPGPNLSQKVCPKKEKQNVKSHDFIVENLFAILKSQEFLFKNILKLINCLEKDTTFNVDEKRLTSIKNKLIACKDVLSNNTNSRDLSDIINNIIEDEITRCRFRHGECKTSAEISLKVPQPRGIEVALEKSSGRSPEKSEDQGSKMLKSKAKIIQLKPKNELLQRSVLDAEARLNSLKLLKKTNSEPNIKFLQLDNDENEKLERSRIEVAESKNLIAVNQKHFLQFEDALWHMMTTIKYMSLKEDYINRCKCAFYNKRRFLTLERELSKQLKQIEEIDHSEKFLVVSDSMFQIMEKRLSNEMKGSLTNSSDRNVVINVITDKISKDEKPLIKLQQKVSLAIEDKKENISLVEEKLRTIKKKGQTVMPKVLEARQNQESFENKQFREALSVLKENVATTPPWKKLSVVEPKEKIFSRSDQETNTVISGKVLQKYVQNKFSQKETQNKSGKKTVKIVEDNFIKENESKVSPIRDNIMKETKITKKNEKHQEQILKEAEVKIAENKTLPILSKGDSEKTEHILENNENKPRKLDDNQENKIQNSENQKKKLSFRSASKQIKALIIVEKENQNIFSGKLRKIENAIKINKENIVTDKAPQKFLTIKPVKTEVVKAVQNVKKLLEIKPEPIKKLYSHQGGTPVQEIKTPLSISELQDKTALYGMIKKASDAKKSESLALQTISNDDCKLLSLQSRMPIVSKINEKSQSLVELKGEADLIHINKRAFDELENTLNTVRIFVKNYPVVMKAKPGLKTSTNKLKPEETNKKNLSTTSYRNTLEKKESYVILKDEADPSITKVFVRDQQKGDFENNINKIDDYKGSIQRMAPPEKRRTFLKTTSQLPSKCLFLNKTEFKKPNHFLPKATIKIIGVSSTTDKYFQMRRTTKTAMKKQQVVTIFPKTSKKNAEKMKPKIKLIKPQEARVTKSISNSTEDSNSNCTSKKP